GAEMTAYSAGTVAVVTNATAARFFDYVGSSFQPRGFLQEQLTYDSGIGRYTLTDTTGQKFVFFDFDTSLPAAQRGSLEGRTDRAGNSTSVTSWTTAGRRTSSSCTTR
ncbi:hypothetical protein, partial [Nocardioides sp.]|uniref:hypothetical protein n=1 Tax=Nocardioides sp. TaxID=35761 RepID=UPI00286DFA2A